MAQEEYIPQWVLNEKKAAEQKAAAAKPSMTISDRNRRQFELIGEDQLALALATGTLQSLGMTEESKREALDWIADRRAKRTLEQAQAATERKQTLQWAKIAGWAAIISVGVGIAAIIVAVWLAR